MATESTDAQSMANSIAVSWQDVFERLEPIDRPSETIYGVPRGGMIATAYLKQAKVTHEPDQATVILDDLVDSGTTKQRWQQRYPDKQFYALFDKNGDSTWIQFPWENETGPEDAVERLLQFVGEDPKRDGLKDTPKRVIRAYAELTEGYKQDPKQILSARFDESHDEMIVVGPVHFYSLCEHHMLPFHGRAIVGYVPSDKIVGLSKLARLVQCFAKRLQVQERLTNQVVQAIQKELSPLGAGCIMEAEHLCMSMRGIRSHRSKMVTSSLHGVLRDDSKARAEFMDLAQNLTSCFPSS